MYMKLDYTREDWEIEAHGECKFVFVFFLLDIIPHSATVVAQHRIQTFARKENKSCVRENTFREWQLTLKQSV